MGNKNSTILRYSLGALFICAILIWLFMPAGALAQDGDNQGDTGITERLVISSSDASDAPLIHLRVFGIDNQGNPIAISSNNIQIRHNGLPASEVEVVGQYSAGTFTIFIVDIPPGVGSEIPAIQASLEQFASPPQMEEPVDYAAIFQVGESQANQLLEPSNFYNSFRNFFATPFETQSGPTALVDSVVTLLNDASDLAPKDGILTSVVIISDGTDAVSSRYKPEDVGTIAAGFGIPLHTIWLENSDLPQIAHKAGQDYLAEISAQSGGLTSQVDQPDQVQAIWDRISAFRQHTVVQYRPVPLAAGTFEVEVSLRVNPDANDSTSVTLPEKTPIIELIVSEEDRQLVIKDLEKPVKLTLSATAGWLDAVDRELTAAQLLVNGTVVQDIDVDDLERFRAEINNLNYGPNSLQIAVVDELGQKATSPIISVDVSATETADEESDAGGTERTGIFNAVLGCLVVAFLLVVLALILYVIYRRRLRERQYGSGEVDKNFNPEGYPDIAPELSAYVSGVGTPYLEILTSVTRMPATIDLTAVEHRIGRNPKEADIAFENDITVSRLHSAILLEGSNYRIYDKGSTSSTLVNGQKVPGFGYQLMDGDEIQLGEVLMRYRNG